MRGATLSRRGARMGGASSSRCWLIGTEQRHIALATFDGLLGIRFEARHGIDITQRRAAEDG